MYEAASLIIGGKEVRPSGNPKLDVLNPATEEVLGSGTTAGAAEVAAAVAAAEQGLEAWKKVSAWDKSAILRKVGVLMRERVDAIANLLTLEIGKPLAEAKGEILGSSDHFEWCADEARRLYDLTLPGRTPASRFEITHEPVGIVLALSAWNFPINLSTRKIAMALAAGCSVIVRPAEEGPAAVAALVQCCHDAGVPPGVVNLLIGSPEAVVAPLMAEPKVRMVSFTGSTRVGQLLVRQSADTLKRLSMELGGHAPFLVLEDADVEKAAQMGAAAKYRNAGQVCTSPSRFYVHKSVIKEFTERMVAGAKAVKVGNGLDATTTMGPMATSRQRDRAERLVEDARKKGATVATGGARPSAMNRGYFYEPTVLTNVPDNANIMTEEPFCPIASIVEVSSTEEAIKRANSLEAGLASYVFSRNEHTLDKVTAELQTGVIGVNNAVVATAEAPFGGVKTSGYGREGGQEGVKEFLNAKFKHRMKL